MNSSRLRARYRRLIWFYFQTIVSLFAWELVLPRLGLRKWARSTRSKRLSNIAARFRALAIQMGGVLIKVGQFLSSRLDVLPEEITRELAGLQDEVPPENFADIRAIAETELGAPLEERFLTFEQQPLAAASLGQVHRARVCENGNSIAPFCDVVVKIQRPYISELIEVDLSALRRFAGWLRLYHPISDRADVQALVDELATNIHKEVDYLAEGRNAETFKAAFKDDPRVHVPRVVWSHTTRRVLVLEDVFAIKITDTNELTAAGIDKTEVAKVLLDTYLQQIFEDGFFHADPHPGNLFITPDPELKTGEKRGWRLTFVDFGMVGRVPTNLRTGLREMLMAVGTRDAARLVHSYQTLGVLLPGADLKALEQAEAQIFELFWGKSMSELRTIGREEMTRFTEGFREAMYSMPFQLPQNLLLLGRTVAILSGMCTGLDPDFNLWRQIVPYAAKMIASEAGEPTWRVWLDELGEIVKNLAALPSQAGRVFARIERGDLNLQMPRVSREISAMTRAVNRLNGGLVFAALTLGGVALYISGHTTVAAVFMGAAIIALIGSAIRSRPRFH